MKIKQIAEKADKELAQLLEDSRRDLAAAVIDQRTKQTPNVKQITALKKTIARALTIKREREIAEMEKTNG